MSISAGLVRRTTLKRLKSSWCGSTSACASVDQLGLMKVEATSNLDIDLFGLSDSTGDSSRVCPSPVRIVSDFRQGSGSGLQRIGRMLL